MSPSSSRGKVNLPSIESAEIKYETITFLFASTNFSFFNQEDIHTQYQRGFHLYMHTHHTRPKLYNRKIGKNTRKKIYQVTLFHKGQLKKEREAEGFFIYFFFLYNTQSNHRFWTVNEGNTKVGRRKKKRFLG